MSEGLPKINVEEEKKEVIPSVKKVEIFSCPHCEKEYKSKPGLSYHVQKCPKKPTPPPKPVVVSTPAPIGAEASKVPKPVAPVVSASLLAAPVNVELLQKNLRDAQFKERELSIQNEVLTSENKRIKESSYEKDKKIYELQKELNKLRENNYDLMYPRLEEKNKRLTEENYKLKREIDDLKEENEDLREESRHDKKMFTDMVNSAIVKAENNPNQVIHRNIQNNRKNNYTIQIFDPELSRQLQHNPIAGCNEVRDIINRIMAQAGLCHQTGMGFGENMNMEEMGNSISQLMNSIFNNNGSDEDEEPRDMAGVEGEVETSSKKYGYRFV